MIVYFFFGSVCGDGFFLMFNFDDENLVGDGWLVFNLVRVRLLRFWFNFFEVYERMRKDDGFVGV